MCLSACLFQNSVNSKNFTRYVHFKLSGTHLYCWWIPTWFNKEKMWRWPLFWGVGAMPVSGETFYIGYEKGKNELADKLFTKPIVWHPRHFYWAMKVLITCPSTHQTQRAVGVVDPVQRFYFLLIKFNLQRLETTLVCFILIFVRLQRFPNNFLQVTTRKMRHVLRWGFQSILRQSCVSWGEYWDARRDSKWWFSSWMFRHFLWHSKRSVHWRVNISCNPKLKLRNLLFSHSRSRVKPFLLIFLHNIKNVKRELLFWVPDGGQQLKPKTEAEKSALLQFPVEGHNISPLSLVTLYNKRTRFILFISSSHFASGRGGWDVVSVCRILIFSSVFVVPDFYCVSPMVTTHNWEKVTLHRQLSKGVATKDATTRCHLFKNFNLTNLSLFFQKIFSNKSTK